MRGAAHSIGGIGLAVLAMLALPDVAPAQNSPTTDAAAATPAVSDATAAVPAAATGAASAPAPAMADACKTRSVVLRHCPPADPRAQADAQLKERVERSARQLEKRAELSPAAVDLGTVLIQETRVLEPTDVERFRATLTRKDYLLGRQTYAGERVDRDNFGLRFECGQSFDLMCADQPGRPATAHWMNGR